MSDLINVPKPEWERLQERARKLAQEKSYLQLVNSLMNRLSEVPGLARTVEAMLRLIVDHLGGGNVALYYPVASRIHYADVFGVRKELQGVEEVEDPLVRGVFERREFAEELGDFADTKMLTPAFTKASSWALPLLVGGKLVGVLKTEGMLMAATEIRTALQPFFNYAALVLNNEVQGYLEHMGAAQLAAIVQSSDDAIIGKTLAGVITHWNRGAERIYGYAAAEVVGRSVSLLVPPGQADEVSRILARLQQGHPVEHFETVRRRKDGRDIHVSLTISPIKDAAGRLVGASTIARDITERRKAGEELRRMNRALRMLSDSNQALIRTTDETTLLNEICQTVVDVGGYRMAWVGFAEHDVQKSVRKAAQAGHEEGYIKAMEITWADETRGRGPIGTAIRTGQPFIARDIPHNPACAPWQEAARQRGYQSSIALPLASGGQTFGALGIYATEADAFDARELEVLRELAGDLSFGIAARRTRLAHQAAEQRMELLDFALNHVWEAAYLVDEGARVQYVNDQGCRVLGYQRDELLGLQVSDIDPDFPATRWAEHWRELKAKGTLLFEGRHRTKDGRLFPVEIAANYFEYDGRSFNLALVRDITERKRTEEVLRESEERFRLAFDLAGVGMALLSIEGRWLQTNRALGEMLGYSPDELRQTTFQELTHPDDLTGNLDIARRLVAGQIPYMQVEKRYRHRAGHYIWARLTTTVVRSAPGEPLYFVSQIENITDRKQAEQTRLTHVRFLESMDQVNRAIQGSNNPEQVMRDVLDSALAIFDCDRAWLVHPCDPAAALWRVPMERTRPEYPGALARDAEIPMDAEVARVLQTFLDSSGPVTFGPGSEQEVPSGVARAFGVQSQIALALYPKVGKPYVFGLHQCSRPRVWTLEEKQLLQEIGRRLADALTSLLAARELREGEERYRDLYENAPNAYYSIGADGVIRRCNRRAAELLGCAVGDLVGRPVLELYADTAHGKAKAAQVLERFRTGETVRDAELEMQKADGQPVWVSLTVSAVRDARGRVVESRSMAVDITERKRAEAEREQFSKFFQSSNDLMVIADPNGCFKKVNPACSRVLGYSEAELLSQPFIELIHPEDRQSTQEEIARQIQRGYTLDFENRYVCKDGSIRHLSWHATFVAEEGITYGTARDVTELKRAEEAVRASEARFRALFEHSPVPIGEEDYSAVRGLLDDLKEQGVSDLEAYLQEHPEVVRECAERVRLIDVNQAALALHEASSKEELLKGLLRTFTPESFAAFRSALAGLWKGQTQITLETVIQTLGGKRRSANMFLSVTPGCERTLSRILVSLIDITERKQTEEVLHEREEEFRALVENASDTIVRYDLAGRRKYVNPVFEQLAGQPADQLIGKTPTESYVGNLDVGTRSLEAIERVVREAAPVEIEVTWKDASGDPRCFQNRFTPELDRAGKVASVLSVARDITPLKLTEEKLRKLSRAVEQSPASIVITDTTGRIEYVNPKFTAVTGYSLDEALGQNPRILKSGEMAHEHYQRMWQTIAAGKEWRGELHNRKKNGELYWETASISPIFDATGAITHYLAVKEDITEHKRLEEELRQAQKMQAFGQLAGGVAHDFNNLLTVIQGNVSLAQVHEPGSSDQMAVLGEIARATEKAANLTRQLLLFSRRQAAQLKNLDLNEVVESMTRMLRRLIGEHISLVAHYAPGGAPVHADPGMLEQVLMNLAVNSRDAMPNGGRLSIRTEAVVLAEDMSGANPKARPGSFVRLSVSDTGSGIAPEHLPRIFEPFFTTKGVGKGTGLGLATVYGIVEQHQGWIDVESQVGVGTAFHIYLPRVVAAVAEAATVQRAKAAGPRGTETILLVEDEPAVRALARQVLARHGYRVLEAASGPEALRLWAEHNASIDLLLTDMVMPEGMSGRALADRLQADRPGLKVIFSSGYADEMLEESSTLRDAPNFLAKPFGVTELLRKVRFWLDAADRPPGGG